MKTLALLMVVAIFQCVASDIPANRRVMYWGWETGASISRTLQCDGRDVSNAVAIVCGPNHNLALLATGEVVGWGWNRSGQATGISVQSLEFASGTVRLDGQPLKSVRSLAIGRNLSYALLESGQVAVWGDASPELLDHAHRLRDVQLLAASEGQFLVADRNSKITLWPPSMMAAGQAPATSINLLSVVISGTMPNQSSGMALLRDGTVVRWGHVPDVPPGLSNIVAIAYGEGERTSRGHGLALKADGRVVGWGDNVWGQAQPPPNLSEVVAIAAGSTHSLALRKDGTIMGWGDNRWGQLNIPADLVGVVAIAAGGYKSAAIIRREE